MTRPKRYGSLAGFLAGKSEKPTVKTQLAQQFGTTRQGHVNTRQAAQELGVSQRTVQRWIKNGRMPASPKGQQAAAEVQQWRNTPEGRRQIMGPRRADRLAKGFAANIAGTFQISSDTRKRAVNINFDAEHAAALVEAHLNGDQDAMRHIIDDAAAEAFGGGSVSVDVASIG